MDVFSLVHANVRSIIVIYMYFPIDYYVHLGYLAINVYGFPLDNVDALTT
mgnify:CR=1 FL=1